MATTGRADEDLTVARLSLSGQKQVGGASVSGYVQVSQGLDAFGATTRNAPGLTRSDADGVFTKLNASLSLYRDIGRYAGVYARLRASGPTIRS